MMKTESAIKKIEKYLGVECIKGQNKYSFQYGNRIGSFMFNEDGTAGSWHNRQISDESDIQADYFAGYYLKNLTQLLHSMKSPPPKFKQGSFIRGKKTKRTVRYGISDRCGLIMGFGTYGQIHIQWVGDEHISIYNHERDLELFEE